MLETAEADLGDKFLGTGSTGSATHLIADAVHNIFSDGEPRE